MTVAFSLRSSMDTGLPTTILLPTTVTLLPVNSISYAFNTSITASAVHGENPVVSPANTFAILIGEIPSKSFLGSIIFSISFSLIVRGSGLNNKIPVTSSSSLISLKAFLNASSLISCGKT